MYYTPRNIVNTKEVYAVGNSKRNIFCTVLSCGREGSPKENGCDRVCTRSDNSELLQLVLLVVIMPYLMRMFKLIRKKCQSILFEITSLDAHFQNYSREKLKMSDGILVQTMFKYRMHIMSNNAQCTATGSTIS